MVSIKLDTVATTFSFAAFLDGHRVTHQKIPPLLRSHTKRIRSLPAWTSLRTLCCQSRSRVGFIAKARAHRRDSGTEGRAEGADQTVVPVLAPTADNSRHSRQLSTIGTADAHDIDENKKCENPQENEHFPGVSVVPSQWAMSDLNQRLPPCKGGALAN